MNNFTIKLFMLVLLVTGIRFNANSQCWPTLTGTDGEATLNPGGGGSGSSTIQMIVNKGGNFQVQEEGLNVIYNNSTATPGTAYNNVPGTTHGIMFRIGTTYWTFGSFGTATAYNSVITGFTARPGNGAEVTSTFSCPATNSVKMSRNIVWGGRTYTFNVTYTWTAGKRVLATYDVVIPSGNTAEVSLVHGWDTYLGGSDNGTGSYYGGTAPIVTASSGCTAYQGFQYKSGTPWSSYFCDDFHEMDTRLATDMLYASTDVNTAVNDKGVAITINFGTAAGTYQNQSYMLFGPTSVAPIVTAGTINNVCPATTITQAMADAFVSNASEGTLVWHTVASNPTAANKVNFPITSGSGTIYPYFMNGASCFSTVGVGKSYSFVTCNLSAATNDTFNVTAGTATASVFANDKANDGSVPNSTTADVTLINAGGSGATINADGTISTTNTPPGNYTLTYQLCSPKGQTSTCVTATVNLTVTVVQGNGSINCNSSLIMNAPVAGAPANHVLRLQVNVTTIGTIDFAISGSGFSLLKGNTYSYAATATGTQIVDIPVKYSGAALSTLTINAYRGGTTTHITNSPCSLDLTQAADVRNGVINVWSKECLPTCGPALK